MTDIMRHRGPDSRGFYVSQGIGLGIQRLSIIDLQTGDQPISNEDGTVIVVCNGEIYNFLELRKKLVSGGHHFRTKSDAEVIVHLYEDFGTEFLHHLRGMFGFALWDKQCRQLILARDRIGIKPLHYAVKENALYFASEIKSILIANKIERRVDVGALQDLFTFGFITSPKTLFTKIRRLLPGHYLLFKNGTLTLNRYWEIEFPTHTDEDRQMSAREWAEALLEELEESVRLHMRSDVEIGAWLSAGIDSSGIVGLMNRFTDKNIKTFSLSFEDHDADEMTNQKILGDFQGFNIMKHRAICKSKDFQLFPRALWHCEDPFIGAVEIPRMILSEMASKSVKVVLTGEGSDEIFGGYPWYLIDKVLRPFSKIPLPLRRMMALISFINKWRPRAYNVLLAPRKMNHDRYRRLIGATFLKDYNKLFSGDIRQELSHMKDSEDWWPVFPEHFYHLHPFYQLQYYDLKIRLPDAIVHHLDRASMAHALEARVPFLDHKLLEFCARIPPSLKMKGVNEKYILRRSLKGVLPDEIIRRKKFGMRAPFQQWLREDLPDFAVDLLSRDRLHEKGYFNPDIVLPQLDQHRSGAGNNGKLLLGVLGIQLWDDIFMHGC
jgi:asparagine synthase (glutamine-hydrolysing)